MMKVRVHYGPGRTAWKDDAGAVGAQAVALIVEAA